MSKYQPANEEDGGVDGILGISDITDGKSIWKMLVAECLGTLVLVFVGCGSCIELSAPANYVQIALTFGLTVATLAQTIGHVSGCHINPAVTVSFFVTGDIKFLKALFFIVVQCIGALGGSALLSTVVPENKVGNLGLTVVSEQISPTQGLLMEIILTFLLLFVIQAVCDPMRKDIKSSAPLAIGLAITAAHLCGIQFTGSSINPARTFGPAVMMNSWENHWVYWVGPIVGAVFAGIIYKIFFKVRKGESDSYDF
nr:aquaporin AQPAe.a-like [Leptinotarsa decemlineata]